MTATRASQALRRVLLVAHTRLSWRYLREHARVFSDDPRVRLTVTRAPDRYAAGVAADIRRSEYPVVPLREAISESWDMALFGTHGSDLFFSRTAVRVHIQHGIGAGKLVDGEDFTYGPRWSLWHGHPKYEAMLEASHAVRNRAVAACPQLDPVIRVVGDPTADRLVSSLRHREAYRQALGIAPDETAVLIISTWGSDGLMARFGPRLLPAALRLGSPYRAMLTMHPHLWAGAGTEDTRRRWARCLYPYVQAGLIVCGPDEDWIPYLSAADVAVIDHGSLGVYWSLLTRPTVTIPVPQHLYAPATPIAAVHESSSTLTESAVLNETTTKAVSNFDPDDHAHLGKEIVSYPGQATRRVRDVLYRLLDLEPPSYLPHTNAAPAPAPWLTSTPLDNDIPPER